MGIRVFSPTNLDVIQSNAFLIMVSPCHYSFFECFPAEILKGVGCTFDKDAFKRQKRKISRTHFHEKWEDS